MIDQLSQFHFLQRLRFKQALGGATENGAAFPEQVEGALECFLHIGPHRFVNSPCGLLRIVSIG